MVAKVVLVAAPLVATSDVVLAETTITTTMTSEEFAAMLGMINCGNHQAASCEYCPQGHGEYWCNGDCCWHNGACVPFSEAEDGKSDVVLAETTSTTTVIIEEFVAMLGMINCGNHQAASCEYCPQGHGEYWCNGDCCWHNGACVPFSEAEDGKSDVLAETTSTTTMTVDEFATVLGMINCGNHQAASCEYCPQGHGEYWCNGDCCWHNGACVPFGFDEDSNNTMSEAISV